MYTPKQLSNLLLFDIETASNTSSVKDLSPRMQELWSKRSEFLRNMEKHPENKNLSDDELFLNKAALHAEFGRVVCVSLGMIRFSPEGVPHLVLKTIASENEVELLTKVFNTISAASKDNPLLKLCGHNVKRFDIPFLGKRSLICGLSTPDILNVMDKKPWEIQVVDTTEVWSHGAWQEGFSSLDLIAACLNIDSPKDEMNGSNVTEYFWNGQLEEIKKYCGKDVITLANILLAISKQEKLSNIVYK